MKTDFYIKKNVVTEKTSLLNGKGCYVFEVDNNVNKIELKNSIESNFNVKVRSVNISNILTKGKRKYTSSGTIDKKIKVIKKAFVYLKEGEELDIDKVSL